MRRILFFVLFVLLLPVAAPAAVTVPGGDAAGWTITGNAVPVQRAGAAALFAGEGAVSLERAATCAAPFECAVVFRLHPKAGGSAAVRVSAGFTTAAGPQVFDAAASAAAEAGSISYSCSDANARTTRNGTLKLQAVSERSLAWSDEMRRTIEAQIAATPALDTLRCTLRLALTRETFSAWLNGRLIGQLPATPAGAGSTVRIVLESGAELLSACAQPLAAVNDRYVPVPLDGFVNATALAGGRAIAAKPALQYGAPFRYATPDAAGHDHLDLGPSWTRFGALAGYIDARSGIFGGRWTAADRIDPSRFCTYVPYGQYRALHLLAAFDGEKDSVPAVTAQFYRPDAGHPMNFSGTAPAFSAKSGGVKAFPVTLAGGKRGKLFHVIVPIDPDKMAWFSDLPRVGLELTKAVQPYRAYPDPLEYSWHAAGLPSGVHVYAATLEKAGVEVDPQPDAPAHVWTAPAQPSYTITLRNHGGAATTALVAWTVTDAAGTQVSRDTQTVALPAGPEAVTVRAALRPTRYGLHRVTVSCTANGETNTQARSFAHLHPDTRERGDWARGKGPIIGFWALGGGHDTPDAVTEFTIMGQLGAETTLNNFKSASPEVRALAQHYQMVSRQAFDMGAIYVNSFAFNDAKYDRKNPEATKQYLLQELEKMKVQPGPLNKPEYLPFFPEPQLNRLSSAIFPHHYNGGEYTYSPEEEAYFQDRLNLFLIGARAVRERWPEVKILLPYGDPMYTAQFLAKSPEARALIDGSALDLPLFERMPEQQIDQVVLNRLYPIFQDIKTYKPDPYFVMTEGPAISSADVDTSEEEHANLCTRNMLILFGYGVDNHESANQPFDCANYWGENHYGGGLCTRLPKMMPKLAYVSSATMTRHLNRCNFVKYVPTGSTSVYCQQYKHYRTGKLVHVLWTARGTRPVSVRLAAGRQAEVYDVNDNATIPDAKDGTATFAIGQSPVYLEGLTADAAITLGAPDHSDAAPGRGAVKLANFASGWTLSTQRDEEYENTNKLQIERFPGVMRAQASPAPKAQGGTALAVHLVLEAINVDRRVMPYYTSFVPKTPVAIPGKASALGLWVRAASDWGRVIYSLRDAKGERWLSVGTKEDWNSDDIRCWSAFCFDGWRYLRFQLPASAPYDSYRERGTTWWGSYEGDGIVDLPLTLEKIIVERHNSVIYGNDLAPAKPDDVLLGDLYAEYAAPADRRTEAIRLSRLRMPAPDGAPAMGNPIAELEKSGTGASTRVTRVTDPDHRYDGTRCHVFFEPAAGAASYDVWASPYPDGRGAMKLGAGWTAPGQLLEGLHADTDFYLFVVYTDANGKTSKPSEPLKIRLKNKFVYQ